MMEKMKFVKRRQKDKIVRVEGPPYHTMTLDTVAQLMKSDLEDGLSDDEIISRQKEYGYNEMEGEGGVNPIKLLIKQFINILVLILLIAMVVSFVFKDYVEGGVICAIMFLNAGVGFAQEYKAEKTMESLRQMASPTVNVIRQGQQKTIATRDLVPGDVIVMKSGDVIGADCRVIESFNMDIDEALLTGESVPVNKQPQVIEGELVPLGDRINMCYSSTTLTKGRGRAIVTAIGMDTEIGKIAKRLLEGSDSSRTPLQRSLDRMAVVLLVVAVLSIIIVFGANKFSGIDDQVILYAISTAIAVIPEGLIAVVTLTQAFGVHSMAQANALVRRMAALEMLGAVTNVCSDKTGTLTQSKMVLTRLWRPEEGFYRVSGLGFSIDGQVTPEQEGNTNVVTSENMSTGFRQMVLNAALCNMSEVRKDKEGDGYHGIGDPTEIALQVYAHKLQMGKPQLTNNKVEDNNKENWKVLVEYPFDSTIKRMSVICETPQGNRVAYLKGATERVLESCVGVQMSHGVESMNQDQLEALILPQVEELARGGLRVLSLATRQLKTDGLISYDTFKREDIEQDMIFCGLVGIYDPPRVESKGAVEKCHLAGITVHMLTGDHVATATAIAREVGILPEDYGLEQTTKPEMVVGRSSLVMPATEFDRLSEEQVDALPELPLVVARCSPDTKVKMIEALHRRKRISGMTGDGVNDSPSLKESDIGIAMGQNGSDVAKQAADIVLVDDNFATIVSAVEEGRRVFANISRFCVHMVSVNVAEVTPLLLGLIFLDNTGRSVFPLSPIQILFNNVVTSSPPAMALGLEPVHPQQMLVPPRSTSEGLFSRSNVVDILYYGVMMGLICLANFAIVIFGWGDGNLGSNCNLHYDSSCFLVYRARGALFATMTVLLLLHGYTCRDLKHPAWSWKALTTKQNYYLHGSTIFGFSIMFVALYVPVLNTEVFRHAPIDWEWGMVAASTLVYIAFAEGWKWLRRTWLTRI
ncbi:potassium/sodium efflux P-type ATPase [Halteromyces radiatus]|uniref:potassium/sodium efflux P-type ATPase n=1 Tax=Halteromyces radiatus TaxID=101107 RepID=UPI002220CAC5|nr:potassium/sodium efflux P-type ATPase [Halteromyces radiatus]KAI8096277.1 potassium/sodium efflux P-type ATPase [Halteromyces radiatus]